MSQQEMLTSFSKDKLMIKSEVDKSYRKCEDGRQFDDLQDDQKWSTYNLEEVCGRP